MKYKIFSTVVLVFLMTSCLFANTKNDNLRYQHIHFVITNQTLYPVALTVVFTDGTWEKPVSLNIPILVNSHESYENTLTSLKNGDDLKSFASMKTAQIGNERENYAIFAERGSSQKNYLSADIFDGLGKIFVDSVTNQCNENTSEGYAKCTLVVKDRARSKR